MFTISVNLKPITEHVLADFVVFQLYDIDFRFVTTFEMPETESILTWWPHGNAARVYNKHTLIYIYPSVSSMFAVDVRSLFYTMRLNGSAKPTNA